MDHQPALASAHRAGHPLAADPFRLAPHWNHVLGFRLIPRWTGLPLDHHAYHMHTSEVDIEFDPVKAAANFRKHKINFAHAEQALRDPAAWTIEDPVVGEQRFVTLGTDALGRVLVVVHTPRAERTRLISARKASRGESEQYHA